MTETQKKRCLRRRGARDATTNQTVVRVSLTRTAPQLKIRESNWRIFAQEKFFRFSPDVGRLSDQIMSIANSHINRLIAHAP